MMTMLSYFALTLFSIAMTSYACHGCQFPVYVQSAAETKATRRRDWQARSRSQSAPSTPMQLVIDGGTLRWKNGSGLELFTDQCLQEIHRISPIAEPLFLVSHSTNIGQYHRACVTFRPIPSSPEVVILSHVITADTCGVSKFNYSTAWLLVDIVALYQPLPISRPCALSGGFQLRISGSGTRNKGADNFRRKCGNYVEMRVESDCASDFGMYFDFRLDVCVPRGLFMYTRQRTLCVANWTVGPYTFMLLRHDLLPYSWVLRFQTSLEDSFVAYLLTDLVDDVSDVPTLASRYFRLDMVRSATVPATSLCVDESEVCASTAIRGSPRCETGNTTTASAPALTCPRACGLCNATRPALCKFPSEMSGTWNDGDETGFQFSTAANRKSISMEIPADDDDANAVKARLYCIQWEVAAQRSTQGNRLASNEFLMVNQPAEGCRRRYACARVLFKSTSVMYFRLTETRTWPFTLLQSDPIDCSNFEGETIFRVLISRERRDPIACHLPATQLTNYSVTFGGSGFRHISCDASVIVQPEVRHRVRLRLAECTAAVAGNEVMFDCLDSMFVSATGDVILVTNVALLSTSGSVSSSATDSVIKSNNFSSFGRRTTPNSTIASTSSLAGSSLSLFRQNSVHCWVFARASFPHEFHIVPGSHCSEAAATSSSRDASGDRARTATFVRTRVRSPRLFADDERPTTASTKLENSRLLSALGRDPDMLQSDLDNWQNQQLSRTTVQTDPREIVLADSDETDVSVFALLAAAAVFAFIQCAFLCIL